MDHVLGRLMAERIPFGLMNLDLDYFKDVNDTYGHAAGDEVLQAVARVLASETREVDTLVRAGGDEFVLIFRDLVDVRSLGDVADRIIRRLEEPILYNDVYCRISGSIGLTVSPAGSALTIEELQEEADVALYASKNAEERVILFSQGTSRQIGTAILSTKVVSRARTRANAGWR